MRISFDPGRPRAWRAEGGWLRDEQRRWVLLRGVNFGPRAKLAPYYLPVVPVDDPGGAAEPVERRLERALAEPSLVAALDRLRDLGMNAARVLVIWKALAPRPHAGPSLLPDGARHLDLLRRVVDALAARGLCVVLDFHQDIAHETFGGDGFPDWARAVDEEHPLPPPAPPDKRWQLRYRATGFDDWNEPVMRTLTAFWQNRLTNTAWTPERIVDHPVRDHFVAAMAEAARRFADHPAILGYEPFNEPDNVSLDGDDFDRAILPGYYDAAVTALRAVDPDAFVLLEPPVQWNVFRQPSTRLDVTRWGSRTLFAFHHYDPWTIGWANFLDRGDSMEHKAREWPAQYDAMCAAARGAVQILTELGADNDWDRYATDWRPAISRRLQTRAYIDLQMQNVERKLLHALYWNYELYASSDGKDGWNRENFSLLGPARAPRHVDLVARPYPMRSSAEPTLLTFDVEARRALMLWRGAPATTAPTAIYVPHPRGLAGLPDDARHFPQGFEVRASGGSPAWSSDDQLLTWSPDAASDLHALCICAIGGYDERALPVPPALAPRVLPSLAAVRLRVDAQGNRV